MSWYNLDEGTYFIKSVCDAFFNEAYRNLPYNNMPLSQMILFINNKLKESGLQLADPKTTLTKEVYFTPKNVSEW